MLDANVVDADGEDDFVQELDKISRKGVLSKLLSI